MVSQHDVALLNRFYEALNVADVEACSGALRPARSRSTCRPNVVAAIAPRGHRDVGEYLRGWFDSWHIYQPEPEDFVSAGDQVVALVHLRARGKGSRFDIEEEIADVFEFDGGKISKLRLYVQRDTALEQSQSRLSRTAADSIRRVRARKARERRSRNELCRAIRPTDMARQVGNALEDEAAQPLTEVQRAAPEGCRLLLRAGGQHQRVELRLRRRVGAGADARPAAGSSATAEIAEHAVRDAWRSFSGAVVDRADGRGPRATGAGRRRRAAAADR